MELMELGAKIGSESPGDAGWFSGSRSIVCPLDLDHDFDDDEGDESQACYLGPGGCGPGTCEGSVSGLKSTKSSTVSQLRVKIQLLGLRGDQPGDLHYYWSYLACFVVATVDVPIH